MDKVKQFLAVAGKHHFWILCGLVAIVTIGSWYMSSSALRAEFESQKSKITGAESEAARIQNEPDHPNTEYAEQMDRLTNEYKVSLRKLWEEQYIQQGKNLQWPVETETYRGLTEEFVEQVKVWRPIETTVPPFDPTSKTPDPLKGNFREQYRDFVKSTELPRLAKIIGAEWKPAMMGAAGGGERNFGSSDESAPGVIVQWHGDNQEYLQNTRFDWSKEPNRLPSTLQILYAQEDLWVLESIMKVIKKTNRDADARHNAVVKEIKYLKLGADAVGLSGSVMRLQSAADVAAANNGIAPREAAQTLPLGEGGRLGTGVVQKDPAEGRYVDGAYQPIPPGRLREAFTSNKPEEAFLAVAKRMPVRMHLVVDQRYLNRLLAECGNSNLVIEIRQIRVNRPLYEGGPAEMRVVGGGGGFGGGGEGGFGGSRSTPRYSGGEGGSGTTGEDDRSHYEVDVELYGIVYIYNPVNDAMVTTTGDASGGQVATAPAAATTPAAAPVPAANAPAAPAPAAPGDAVPPANVAPMPVVPAPAEPAPAVPAPMPPAAAPMGT